MRAGAHEQVEVEGNTFGMPSIPFDNWSAGDSTNSEDSPHYEIVPEWWDGETMRRVTGTPEMVGRAVVACTERCECAALLSAFDSTGYSLPTGTPGFLFCGDDGDSLWFLPEDEDLALRLEQNRETEVRKALPSGIHRSVSQGAFVFCCYVRNAGVESAFQFPFHLSTAA